MIGLVRIRPPPELQAGRHAASAPVVLQYRGDANLSGPLHGRGFLVALLGLLACLK